MCTLHRPKFTARPVHISISCVSQSTPCNKACFHSVTHNLRQTLQSLDLRRVEQAGGRGRRVYSGQWTRSNSESDKVAGGGWVWELSIAISRGSNAMRLVTDRGDDGARLTTIKNQRRPRETINATVFFSEIPKNNYIPKLIKLHRVHTKKTKPEIFSIIFTARRVCIARTMPWQGVCTSVCPSLRPSVCHTPVLSLKGYTYPQSYFSPSGSPTILVFPYQTARQYSDGDLPNGGAECKGGMKKSRFSTNIGLYLETDAG